MLILPKDIQIKQDIEKSIKLNRLDAKSNVEIIVEKSWVILKGWVSEAWIKDKIFQIAEAALGLTIVINKLVVIPSGDKTDLEIADRLVEDLDQNINFNIEKINVKVNHSRVELEGSVPSWHAKQEVIETAKKLENVLSVDEKITVRS